MFDMPILPSIEKKDIDTHTVSKCCNSSVSLSTPDDFNKIDSADKNTWVMTIEFICNTCGKVCKVKDIPVENK